MSTLFINGSPNKNGNTVRLANKFLKGEDFKTLNLYTFRTEIAPTITIIISATIVEIAAPLSFHLGIRIKLRTILIRALSIVVFKISFSFFNGIMITFI